MNQKLEAAQKCFDENIRLFANAQNQPEKYNLYNGLSALAEGLQELYLLVQENNQRLRRS